METQEIQPDSAQETQVAQADAALQQLLLVQESDNAIALQIHKRELLPERSAFEALDEKLKQAVALQERIKVHIEELEQDQTKTEAEIAETEESLQESNTRLYSGEITGVRAIEALQEQIAVLKRRKQNSEEIVLEILERRESIESKSATVNEKHDEIQARHTEKANLLKSEEDKIGEILQGLQQQREELTAKIPPNLLSDYEERRDRLGGIGVAALEGRHCIGCDLNLMHPIAEVERMRQSPSGIPVDCSECGRLIIVANRED